MSLTRTARDFANHVPLQFLGHGLANDLPQPGSKDEHAPLPSAVDALHFAGEEVAFAEESPQLHDHNHCVAELVEVQQLQEIIK